jgi:hypothetical protein
VSRSHLEDACFNCSVSRSFWPRSRSSQPSSAVPTPSPPTIRRAAMGHVIHMRAKRPRPARPTARPAVVTAPARAAKTTRIVLKIARSAAAMASAKPARPTPVVPKTALRSAATASATVQKRHSRALTIVRPEHAAASAPICAEAAMPAAATVTVTSASVRPSNVRETRVEPRNPGHGPRFFYAGLYYSAGKPLCWSAFRSRACVFEAASTPCL